MTASLRPVSKLLLALPLLVFVGYLIVYCVYAFALFRFPYDYDQGEGFELNDSILFARGEWPYKDNEAFPFYASNYGPVFHLMVLPMFALFGQTLAAGRVLSFAVTLVVGSVVCAVVYRKTRDRPIALLSGLMVFASTFVYHIGPLFRQHMTMVLFELLAVVAVASWAERTVSLNPRSGSSAGTPGERAERTVGLNPRSGSLAGTPGVSTPGDESPGYETAPGEPGWKRRWHDWHPIGLSMLFLLLAGYTKQLSAATAIAVIAFLFFRAPKKSVIAGLGLAAIAAAIFVGMNAATNGQWLVNSITANANAYDYSQALELYGKFFSLHFVIAGLAIGYLVYELYWDRLSVYSVWFAAALGNAALSGKWGAGESYFITAIVAACIASGLAIGKLKEKLPARRPHAATALGIAIPLLYLAQAWGVRHLPTDGPIFGTLAELIGVGHGASVYADYPYFDAIGYTQVGHLPTGEDTRSGDRIASYVRSGASPGLTEEAMFALRAGKPVVTNPTQLLNLWNNDALDPTNLIAMIHDRAFNVVVLRAQFYPPPVLQAIGVRYEPVDDIWMNGFQYRILGPRRDIGPGCDGARLYAMKRDLERAAPGGKLRIDSRDTTPEGWSGAKGVTEFVYPPDAKREPEYRLWIAPLKWPGTPPARGGAEFLGRSACFMFFDLAGAGTAWPSAREDVRRVLEIQP